MKSFEEILIPTQIELFDELQKMYKGNAIICKNNYILVQGKAPIMLLAHLDTVHEKPVQQICKSPKGDILMSPQGIGGDDRCGVYALVKIYEQSVVKPWLLFTCDEEIGGAGASVFCTNYRKGKLPIELQKLKLLIEIDRKGKNDAVYYECDNKELEKYIISKGFQTAYGSFSDISYIAPELAIAAVNLSSGYYNAHTLHEYINKKHLNATIRKVIEIVSETINPDFPKYEYIKNIQYGYDWNDWGLYSISPTELENIPLEIREEYLALLDFYTVGELEEIRKEYGDKAIPMLFDMELGCQHIDLSQYDKEVLK